MANTSRQRKMTTFGKSALLTAIAASAMLEPQRLTIEELDGDVFVKRLTLGERDQYFADMKEVTKQGGNGNVEAFVYAILTEDGEPMFTLDDADIIKSLPPGLTTTVLHEFNKINRFIAADNDVEGSDLKNS